LKRQLLLELTRRPRSCDMDKVDVAVASYHDVNMNESTSNQLDMRGSRILLKPCSGELTCLFRLVGASSFEWRDS
jgi:hypothetical protein